MPRPNRDGTPASDPNKWTLTEIFLKKLKPQSRKFVVLGHEAARSGRPRTAERRQESEMHLLDAWPSALVPHRSR